MHPSSADRRFARYRSSFTTLLTLAAVVPPLRMATAQAPKLAVSDWSAVEQTLGRKGTLSAGDVIRFGFPRGDLQVTISGLAIKPTLALGSWVAFKRTGRETIAMGDFVLTEAELDPVMKRLQAGGVEQTAVHHHVIGESPRVLYMHISAHGDAMKIAETVYGALSLTNTPLLTPTTAAAPTAPTAAAAPTTPTVPVVPAAPGLDTAGIAQTLGFGGRMNGGVYQVNVPRAEHIMEHGTEITPAMGMATAINFQPTGGGKAAITGDFVLLAAEVNPVIRALMSHGIAVTSVHSHMLTETPRLFFMHFWAVDDAGTLATGLRAALDATKVLKTISR